MAFLFVAAAPGGTAHDDPPSSQRLYHEQVAVQEVLVPVVVRHRGRPVRDLQAKDFRLFVDDRQSSLTSFETGSNAPIHAIFLQDLSGSMEIGPKLELSRQAIEAVLARRRPGDLYTLTTFADGEIRLAPAATSDPAPVRREMEGWVAFGKSAIHDAVARLPGLRRDSGATRGAALLITDGLDNASTVTADEAREAARRTEMPVYVLDVGAAGRDAAAARKNGALLVLSHVTGGKYHPVSGPRRLQAAMHEIVDELRHQYVLGFRTAGGGPSETHKIRVEVDGKRRKLSHRREYKGAPPAV